MAFTGKFKDNDSCTYVHGIKLCGQAHYDEKGQPRAQMIYTPIAPIIQSYYMNYEMAKNMRYRHEQLQMALQRLESDSAPNQYSDFPDSIAHLQHVHELNLFKNETDTAITISGDGAQLTMKKQSNVWVLIATTLNLPPHLRYKAANVITPLVIPGPNPPGNVDSFVYVLYEELAKLSIGLWTWDALSNQYFRLKVFLLEICLALQN